MRGCKSAGRALQLFRRVAPACSRSRGCKRLQRSEAVLVARAVAEAEIVATGKELGIDAEFLDPVRPVRVLIAGAGIAGLVLAVALLKKGIEVTLFEQDMTAIRGEGKYRGPIQV
jgi:pyruvate/2-oxoglutarate dehydrogenase complex dihydrolipoamide dehydrogenase (E3) component